VANAKILVVDDEAYIVELVKFNLEKEGYEVVVAHDGLKALDMVRTEEPDLIILDIMLPRMDGLEVCRLVKQDQALKAIPIIMLTAKGHETYQLVKDKVLEFDDRKVAAEFLKG
jgi:two-component system alkaline phosphatase synthesis response regulator PhoP